MKRAATLAVLGIFAALPATLAVADSFTPVTLTTKIAPVARLDRPLPITVSVRADAGVLDTRTAPLRIRVKLASECGGTYQYTPGPILLDKRLRPQPSTGRPYYAVARGAGKPRSYGVQTVCEFLEEEGDNRVFANDESIQVDVSRQCTAAADRYDAARRQLARAERSRRGVQRAHETAAQDRQAARRACGPGVAL